MGLASLAKVFRHPVLPETRANLRRCWERLPEWLRVPQQMYGRHAEGCGATIGAMPRCDFACTGCYLGEEANRIPALPLEAVKEQMRRLRPVLGARGNLQLTDGEVTLRPAEELVELVRYAVELGLIPMLMTHGDTFRRQPGLLERLMVEGGLTEVSIHVDTTQRGRKGTRFREPRSEEELNPLRDEFAEMIRTARRKTGRRLLAATTLTVSPENLPGVPAIMRWLVENADVFKMVSFQPMAQVGRTVDGLGGGVSVDALWARIAEGLDGPAADPSRILSGQMWLGHSACNRYVPGYVIKEPGRAARYVPVRDARDPSDVERHRIFWGRFGGLTFRGDSLARGIARGLGVALRGADIFARHLGPYLGSLFRRLDPEHPFRFAAAWASGRTRVNGLLIVSHHFMSDFEVATPLGQERLSLCVFQVPVGETLVPMCAVNLNGIRERYYEDIREGRAPGSSLSLHPSLPVIS